MACRSSYLVTGARFVGGGPCDNGLFTSSGIHTALRILISCQLPILLHSWRYSGQYSYIYNPKSEWGPVLATFVLIFFVRHYLLGFPLFALIWHTAIKGDWQSLLSFRKCSTIYFHHCLIRRGIALLPISCLGTCVQGFGDLLLHFLLVMVTLLGIGEKEFWSPLHP